MCEIIMNSVKRLEFSILNLEENGVLNVHTLAKIVEQNVGQFGQNWVKSGQTQMI